MKCYFHDCSLTARLFEGRPSTQDDVVHMYMYVHVHVYNASVAQLVERSVYSVECRGFESLPIFLWKSDCLGCAVLLGLLFV